MQKAKDGENPGEKVAGKAARISSKT